MAAFWYSLVGVLFAAYFVLAGFDYGVGMLARRLGRTEEEKRRALATVGPFFLGNEVWLVGAIGALFGAFPLLDGKLLGTSSTLLSLLLCGLVAFTAAVQIRSRARRGRGVFDLVIGVGALVTVLGWGAFLGQLLQGAHGLPNWFSLLCAVAFAMLILVHGAVFLAWRGTPELRTRAVSVATSGILPVLIAVAVVAAAGFFAADAVEQPAVAVAGVLVLAGAVFLTGRAVAAGRYLRAVLLSSLAVFVPVLVIGFARLPYGYVDAADPANSLTVAEGATNAAAFDLLTLVAAPMIPVLLAFQAVQWWLWRRRETSTTPLFY